MFYDSLVSIVLPPGTLVVGFADDVAVIVIAHTTTFIEKIMNAILNTVYHWLDSNGLMPKV